MNRLFLLLLSFVVLAAASLHAAKKPNVVCILVDDLGYSDLSSFGGTDIRTPAIDGMMKAGLRFDQFYSNCTVCTPTRASLLTGRYPDLVGAPGVIRQWDETSWGYFQPTGPTMPELMRKAGYHTAMVGKWHLGFESPNIPNDRGFDFFHGFLADMMDDYWTHLRGGVNWMRLNKKEVKAKGHATEVFTRWAIDYVKKQSADEKKPFFLYLAYNAPHFPIQPPKDWLVKVQKREPQLSKKRATNVAFVEHMDHEIGKFMDALKELGIAEDTLVVFSSDNGGSIPMAHSMVSCVEGSRTIGKVESVCRLVLVWPGRSTPVAPMHPASPWICCLLLRDCRVKVEHEIEGQSFIGPTEGLQGRSNRSLIFVRREGNRRYQGAPTTHSCGPWKLLQNTPLNPCSWST